MSKNMEHILLHCQLATTLQGDILGGLEFLEQCQDL